MTLRHLLCAVIVGCPLLPPAGDSERSPLVLYVAPEGNDGWSGALPSPNATKTDGPFRTPERCRDALRWMKRQHTIPAEGVTIMFRGGLYHAQQTLELTGEDSGTRQAPVRWTVFPGESAWLTGGRTLDRFRPVTDSSILSRLREGARQHVVVADLGELGITDFGAIAQRGSPGIELFFQDQRMTLARWPNEGWLLIADVPQRGDSLYNSGLDRERRFDGVPAGRHFGRIQYSEKRPHQWSRENEIVLHGYWTFDWSDSYQGVESIDTLRQEITIRPPHHSYGYTKHQRYVFLNVLEEIDAPGEWYLDRTRGLLYFWPPAPLTPGAATVSVLAAPFIRLTGCSDILIERLHFTVARSNGVVVTGGSRNLIAGCSFSNLGDQAVVIDGGTDNGVQSCDLSALARGGILLRGGDRRTLTPGNNYAANNHLSNFSCWLRTGQHGIIVDGVGNRLAHNLIHHSPFEAIYVLGNDHLIEFNEIHHVTQETGDAGALHTGRDWTWRGTVIRHNFFHDLKGPGLHGVMGVYLDDWASGFTVEGNLFVNAGRATLIGGGRDNVVENNIYVNCSPSVHVDARGLGWAGYYFDGTRPELLAKMEEMNYTAPPYSIRYPELLTLYEDEPAIPKYNRIVRNISAGGRWLDIYDYLAFDFTVVTMTDNIIADSILLRRRKDGETGWDPYYLNIDANEGYISFGRTSATVKELEGNVVLVSDPGFLNPAAGNFNLKEDAPALARGFKPLPLSEIGLQVDAYRKTVRRQPQ